jgi:hypothetical protein
MLKKIFGKIGARIKDVVNSAREFVKENPILVSALIITGGLYAAGAFGAAGVGAGVGTAGAGAAAGAPAAVTPSLMAAPGAVTSAADLAAFGAPTGTGIGGIISGAGEFFAGTPARSTLTAAGLQAVGGAFGAEEERRMREKEARERRAFEERMFGKRQQAEEEARRITFAPTRPRFSTRRPSGMIAQALPREAIQMTPSQALQLRKTGQL